MRRIPLSLGLTALLLTASGCFEVEQSYTLRADLSGTAELRMSAEFEPRVRENLAQVLALEGKSGPITQAQVDEAIEEFLGGIENYTRPEVLASIKEENQKRLAPGVRLADYSVRREDKRVKALFGLAFDDVRKVPRVSLAGESGPGGPGFFPESPFAGFQVQEEEGAVLVSLRPEETFQAYFGSSKDETGGDEAAAGEQLQKDLRSLDHFTVRLEAPFEVLGTNATRREGSTLVWELDNRGVLEPAPEIRMKGFWVRFKK